jgi:MFS family permease
VFIASGSVLVLEILAVRLLTPYVGLTLEMTTSIIGAVLAGIAAGAALGGWVADRVNARRLAVGLLVAGGLLALLTVPIVRALGPSASDGGVASAVGVTGAALVPVAAVLSAVSPTVAHLQLQSLHGRGTIVGRLSAWATAGALIGTFGTGFVLVPLLPVGDSVLAVGVLLIATGAALAAYIKLVDPLKVAVGAVLAVALMALTIAQRSPCEAETIYHCVRIERDPVRPAAEALVLDREFNSLVEQGNPRYLGFPYVRWIASEISGIGRPGTPLDAVFVGGGAFTLPRWLQATRPGSRSNVLEVDGKLVEFDRKRFGLRTTPNLRATVGDARLTMRRERSASADLIVGDAFSGLTVPWQLMTTEWMHEILRVLRPGGVYALNMIDFGPLNLLRAESATLLAMFRNVRLITWVTSNRRPEGGNMVLIASDGPLPPERGPLSGAATLERAAVARLTGGAQRLTDDYAPVDQLETRQGGV